MTRIFPLATTALAIFASRALAESEAPSISPAPSSAPSFPIQVRPFDWDINRVGNAEIAFSSDADMSEIKIHYIVAIRDTVIQAFEADCSTPVSTDVAKLSSDTVIISPTHANFTVSVDIAKGNVTTSSIWSEPAVGEGLISMCIRVDLVRDNPVKTSVNFHEQRIFVRVGLVQGFEVTGIDLTRLNPTDETGTATVDYNVTACQCDEFGICGSTILTQGSGVWLCLETSEEGIQIAEVRSLTMAQGDFNTTPIVGGVEDPLTFVAINGTGKEATIRYQLISAFFSDPSPADIIASGSVLLAFTNGTGRRLLRDVNVMQRELEMDAELEKTENQFQLELSLESADQMEESSAFTAGLASMIVVMICGAVAMA